MEEQEARRKGLFMFLSGRVYKSWNSDYRDENGILVKKGHTIDWGIEHVAWDLANSEEPPVIYQACDPHDKKPFAMTWTAGYPDGRKVVFMEWPDAECEPYHKTEERALTVKEYVDIINRKENGKFKIKVYRRIGDKNYMFTRRTRDDTVNSTALELIRVSKGKIRFVPSRGDNDANRHIVQDQILPQPWVDREGIMHTIPLLRADASCTNLHHAMERWKWVKNAGKALETKPRLGDQTDSKHKCFPNTIEYMLSHYRYMFPSEWLDEENEADEDEEQWERTARRQQAAAISGYSY